MGNSLNKSNQEHFSIIRKESVKNTYEDVQNIINDTIMEDAQNCKMDMNIKQALGFNCPEGVVGMPEKIGISGSIQQNAVASIIRNCYQDSDKASKVANEIDNKLKQTAAIKGSSLDLIMWGDTENKTDFKTYMTNKLVAMAKQPCDVTFGIYQGISLGCPREIDISGNISQTASITASGDCTQISKTISDIANKIVRDVSQDATSGENWSDILLVVGIIMVLLAVIGLGVVLAKGKKEKPNRPYDPRYDPRYGRGEEIVQEVQEQKMSSDFQEMQLSYDF